MEDRKPSDEGWTEKCNRLAAEEEAEENARRNEPGMVKIQKSFTFEQISRWFGRLKAKMKKPKNSKLPMLILALLPIFLCNCSINSASKVGPDGTKTSYYSGAVGGKGGAVHGDTAQGGLSMASFYDNEKSFRDGVIGLVTYGVADVIGGVVKAGQAADTAQHAASQAAGVSNAKTAANVANTSTTAKLIEGVGIKGEVPISAVGLPASP